MTKPNKETMKGWVLDEYLKRYYIQLAWSTAGHKDP
jgi:hypothetical protein